MNKIELAQTNAVNVDLLESILRQKFPNKKVKRQNWGINSPFLWIKMSFWIRVAVGITQKPKKQKTIVIVNDHYTVGAWLLLGWPAYWIFRKHHRRDVMNAVRAGLRERTNVIFLN